MQFDKKLAREILEIIADFPVDFLFYASPDKAAPGNFIDRISKEICDKVDFRDMLAHLYILSHSGLIYPRLDLKALQKLKDQHPYNTLP